MLNTGQRRYGLPSPAVPTETSAAGTVWTEGVALVVADTADSEFLDCRLASRRGLTTTQHHCLVAGYSRLGVLTVSRPGASFQEPDRRAMTRIVDVHPDVVAFFRNWQASFQATGIDTRVALDATYSGLPGLEGMGLTDDERRMVLRFDPSTKDPANDTIGFFVAKFRKRLPETGHIATR